MQSFASNDDQKQIAVSILVVGYNSADLISNCLSSIPAACQKYTFEVLLVDQGDGSTEALVSDHYPEVQICPSQGNLGFAGGNNLLAQHATGRYLLLLNPDVELKPDAIDLLLDATETYPKASAWGGVTLNRDGRPDIGNSVHVPSLKEMFSRIVGKSSAALDVSDTLGDDVQVEALSGGFVLIEREAWDIANGLDDRYFLYCEEVDFFYRLSLQGHTFWRVGAARAFHDIGHGQKASPTRQLYSAAGIMQFARTHWSPTKQNLAFVLMWLGASIRFSIGTLLGRWKSNLAETAEAQRFLVLRPNAWRFGYDPSRGLMVHINSQK